MTDKKYYYCSFCGKSQDEVNQVISGPDVCICDICVRDCVKVLAEKGHWPPIGMPGVPADKASFYRGLMALAGYIGPVCVAAVTSAMGDQSLTEGGHEAMAKSPESTETERSEGGLQ